jgi:hypothetical protein
MLLGHQTNPNITNIYRIMKSGYLKSGQKTGIVRMWGWDNPSKYIYLMFYDITGRPPHFELDSNLLLENTSYLNVSWNGEPEKDSISINGSKINKKQLKKILKKYRNDLKKLYESTHEILVEEDIDLVKYLKKITLFNDVKGKKTYYKLLKLMKIKYPNVEIIMYNPKKN